MSVFRQIEPNQVIITPFETNAEINLNTLVSQSVDIYVAEFDNYKYSISDDTDIRNLNLSGSNGIYRNILHSSLNQSFYYDYKNNPFSKLSEYYINQKRLLWKKAYMFSIDRQYYIEGIKTNTLSIVISDIISGSVISVTDDGYGNLIDSNKYNNIYSEIEPNLLAHYSFNDGFYYNDDLLNAIYPNKYLNDDKQTEYNHVLLDNTLYNHDGYRNNITFGTNINGNYAIFNGIDSYIRINNHQHFNFKLDDEFAITFLIKTTDNNKIILSKNGSITQEEIQRLQVTNGDFINVQQNITQEYRYDYYPFEIGITNNKIYFAQSDGEITITCNSITSINDNNWHYIICQKNSNSELQLIIDGTLEDTQDTSTLEYNIDNNSDVMIGKLINNMFTGELDDVKFYNNYIPIDLVSTLSGLVLNHNYEYYVGNVFYDNGFIVLTSPNYQNLSDTFDVDINFNSIKTIYEHEYVCVVQAGELNITVNPTVLKKRRNYITDEIQDKFLSTDFSPYVTTVGLYNESAELIAIGKLSRPVPKLPDLDMTFIIKFDL